jgi:hypothetical protein
MRTEKLLVGIILLATVGCGDGLSSPYPSMAWGPASNSLFKPSSSEAYGVLGDWFPCKDLACTALADDGYRFTQQGRWHALEAPGSSLEAEESYCVEQSGKQSGSYTLSGSTVTLRPDVGNGVQTATFAMQGTDAANVSFSIMGEVIKVPMRRINPPRSSGPCQDDQPVPVPMP